MAVIKDIDESQAPLLDHLIELRARLVRCVLALALAVVALGLGSLLAWLVITQLFEFDWLPDWSEIFAVLGMGLAVVMAFAIGGSLPLLRAKPAQALRAL